MLSHKKSKVQFYSDLKSAFPEIAQKEFWNDHDYFIEPVSSSGIMTEIGKIVIVWAERDELEKIINLMRFFEESYQIYTNDITCYIYTDFLPNIISIENSELREIIKTLILTETMKLYNKLLDLGFYSESSTTKSYPSSPHTV